MRRIAFAAAAPCFARAASTDVQSTAAGFFRSLIHGKDLVPYPAKACGEEEGDNLKDVLQKIEELTDKATKEEQLSIVVDSGLFGAQIPEDIGGLALSHSSVAFAMENLALKNPSLAYNALLHCGSASYLLKTAASKEQQGRWFPNMSEGTMVVGWAVEEGTCWSDVSQDAAVGVFKAENSTFVLNGTKIPVVGTGATHYLTAVKTDTQSTDATGAPVLAKKMSFFMVDRKSAGVKVIPNADGSSSVLVLENVEVPSDSMVGTAGEGFTQYEIAKHQCNYAIAAALVGTMKKALDSLPAHCAGLTDFEGNVSQSIVSRTWVDYSAKVYGVESAIYALTANLDREAEDCLIESALIASLASEVAGEFAATLEKVLGCSPDPQLQTTLKQVNQMALLCNDTDMLKQTAALCGIEDFGIWFRNTSTLTMMQIRTLRSLGQTDKFPSKGKNLSNEIAKLEKAVVSFGGAVEHFFVKNGHRCGNDTLKLQRIADAASLLLAASCAVSRVDKSTAQKQPTAATEAQLASLFVVDAVTSVETLSNQMMNSARGCDDTLGRIGADLADRFCADEEEAEA